jgi:hypothetical protein
VRASGAAFEVALAKSGEFSMDSLARGRFTQGCAASDRRGFTLGYAERALQARGHGSRKDGTWRGGRLVSRRRWPDCGFWLIVAATRAETDSGVRVSGFRMGGK